jgi:hypothetical protein
VFLKLNQYYVVYTHPVAPFADVHGNVIVSLRTTAELMGLTVRVGPIGPAMTVSSRGTSVTFAVGRPSAIVVRDSAPGKPTEIPVIPSPAAIQPSGDIVVPIRPLIAAFSIRARFDARYRILVLSDQRMMRAPAASATMDLEERIGAKPDTEQLVPTSFSWTRIRVPGARPNEVRISLHDVGPTAVRDGQQAVYIILERMNRIASIAGRNFRISPDTGRSRDPCVKAAKGFDCTIRFSDVVSIGDNAVRYIAVRTRLRD